MVHKVAAFIFVAGVLASCGGPGHSLPPIGDANLSRYTLGPGDEVRISVFGVDAMTNDYRVGDAGTISMPLIGDVQAKGRTTDDLEAAIEKRVGEAQIEGHPSVNVQVQHYRPFFILGQVQSPGSYPYVPGMTVRTAAAIAGGYTFRAEEDVCGITRTVDGKTVDGRAEAMTPVLPGDTIYIYESWF